MKFVKGMVLGTVLVTGITLMYKEGLMNKKNLIKKGRQIARKINIF